MTQALRATGPGRPKDPEKRAAVIEAATQLFLDKGFEGSSMEAIAGAAGVSKITLYSHFKDKEALFKEAVRCKCEEHEAPILHASIEGLDAREALTAVARGFLRLVYSDEALAMFRLVCTPSPTPSKIGTLFLEAGPERALVQLSDLLSRLQQAGQLEMQDVRVAAEQFYSLLKGTCHMRLLMHVSQRPDEDTLERHIQTTVDTFLRAYATR